MFGDRADSALAVPTAKETKTMTDTAIKTDEESLDKYFMLKDSSEIGLERLRCRESADSPLT
jgi:hypothetical protein